VERERAQALMDTQQFIDCDASRFDGAGQAITEILRELTKRGIVPAA
jgi:hypothetical protein